MGYDIEKDIIAGLPDRALDSTDIVVAHESGNPNNTGNESLDNEISFMKNNWNKGAQAYTSHWVGGGGRIVQLAPTGTKQNGAGHVANKVAYAHVELARTDKQSVFDEDYKAYIWLLRDLAGEADLPIELDTGKKKGIKSHRWVTDNLGGTDHRDPYAYLESFGISEAQFKKDIKNGLSKDTKPSKPKPKPEPKPNNKIKTGDKVTIKKNASKYSTGENIPAKYKGKSFTVQQVKSGKVLLKELYSWINTSNLEGQRNDSPATGKGFSVGGTAVIKQSAKTYATGETIPAKHKGKNYTVQQVKSDRVLIKELYSWVRKSDLQGGGTATKPKSFNVGDKVKIQNSASKYTTGESIPKRYKGKSYTVQQVKSGSVLIKELVSWVNKKDITK